MLPQNQGAVQKIVVADDDDLLSGVLVQALQASGYDAVRAPNGIPDADLVAGSQLVILDAHIPGVVFADALHTLREAGIRVLVLSGEPSAPTGVPSEQFLSKPVDLHSLLAAVSRLAAATTAS